MATIHKVGTQFMGKMEFDTVINGHHITLDTVAAGGGEDKGASPKPLILSALAGCTGMDVVGVLNKMRATYSDFSIDVEGDLTNDHPRVYSEIRVKYSIRTADHSKMEKAVNLSKDTYCGVYAMLKKVCEVKFEIVYL
ncbi:MAG: OsmC family protein [bacterium]|nr:OsmC family protein [bacterium]